MSQELSVVGQRIPRIDANEKATGSTVYTGDIALSRMIIGKVLHSPYPHAKIVKIDKSKAETLPGVVAVITSEDVPDYKFTMTTDDKMLRNPEVIKNLILDQQIFNDKMRYVGDPVAAVAAENESIAEQAIDLIEVEYEELPAVFDPVEAMKPGAPQLHDSSKNNIAGHQIYPFPQGDVEKGFEEADVIVEGTFSTSKMHPAQMEPTACIASFDANGSLTVWSPTQEAFLLREKIGDIFDIPSGKIRYLTQFAGGSFGGRGVSLTLDPICVALAKVTGRPVKMIYSREEEFFGLETRSSFIQSGKIGVKKDGTITSMYTKAICNSGAYVSHSPAVTGVNVDHFLGLYKCPNSKGEAEIVYTNQPVSGGIRGYGNPQAMWVLEQLLDEAAQKIGMDPVEFRKMNHRQTGDPSFAPSIPIENCALDECIKLAAEKFNWKEKKARKKDEGIKKKGVGMVTVSHVSGAFPVLSEHTNAFIKMNEDGSADVLASCCEMGQGLLTALSQIAAEELGVRFEDINLINNDTSVTMYDVGQHASRSTHGTGEAVRRAAAQAKEQVLERAARLMEASVDDLEARLGKVYVKGSPDKGITIREVCHEAAHNLDGDCMNITGVCSYEAPMSPIYQAVFAEVEVDTETGVVRPLRITVAHDIGRAINPLIVEGQLEGGVVMSIGYALTENFIVNEKTGVLESDNYTSYKIPSTPDIPKIDVIIVEEPVESGPFGAKSVGESATVGIAPAVGNAIYDAVGVRVGDLPVTPEKVLRALKEKE